MLASWRQSNLEKPGTVRYAGILKNVRNRTIRGVTTAGFNLFPQPKERFRGDGLVLGEDGPISAEFTALQFKVTLCSYAILRACGCAFWYTSSIRPVETLV